MMPQHQQIRRRINGTIDLDFYRRKATMERAACRTSFLRRMHPVKAIMLVGVMIAMPVVMFSAGRSGCEPGPARAINLAKRVR